MMTEVQNPAPEATPQEEPAPEMPEPSAPAEGGEEDDEQSGEQQG
jgi:hypothetical protein